jgi:hypothetical protein
MRSARRKPGPSRSVDARAPHVATEAVVERQGDESARTLYAAFAEYNARFFAGKLGSPLVLITQPQSLRNLGDYIERDVMGLESRIRIAPVAVRQGERFARDVLLHEMIHAWQSEVADVHEKGYRGHGPKFAAECNRIGALLGLPPVGVKGRRGLPDCIYWPLCVRPDGYYPDPYRPPRRKMRSRRAGKPGDDRRPPTSADLLRRILPLLPHLVPSHLRKLAAATSKELAARIVG